MNNIVSEAEKPQTSKTPVCDFHFHWMKLSNDPHSLKHCRETLHGSN